LLRNFCGMAGLGLLSAAALGGAFGWTGPMAYLLVTEGALAHHSVTPWVWPARPPHDHGAAICASLVIAAGLALLTVRGPRASIRESGQAS
jgi:sugar phosphate permease